MRNSISAVGLLWNMAAVLWRVSSVSSQTLVGCNTGFFFFTQPPRVLPCDPYPSTISGSSFFRVECSVIVPHPLAGMSAIVWSKLGEDGVVKELMDSSGKITIDDNLVEDAVAEFATIRSVLKVSGLRLNRTESIGQYFCQLTLEVDGETAISSNASISVQIFESQSYTNLDKCDNGHVFVSLRPTCLSLSDNVVLPTAPPDNNPTISTTICSDCETPPTSSTLTFSLTTIIIISSVGGVLVLLVCLLVVVLLVTCVWVRKRSASKSSLRTFKDRSIPLSSSMNNINVVEITSSRSNLVTPSSPIDMPIVNHFPAPSHPPPLRTTLPSRSKQSVTQSVSNASSITSSTVLVRKGRAATVIGKLRHACTPTEEEYSSVERVVATNPDNRELYKSLITGNMDDPPIYSTANASLHGSMESIHCIHDDQPVYSEPMIPLSVSMLSLVSMENKDSDQPEYSEPHLPHSLSSFSLYSQCKEGEDELHHQARSRLSLPLNQRLGVHSTEDPALNEDQPIYSEVEETPSPTKKISIDSTHSSPSRRLDRKRPIIPPRPSFLQPNKQGPLHKEPSWEKPHYLERVVQSHLSIQRESVDGEYVFPNGMVESNIDQSSKGQQWEVVQLRNHDIDPPPHQLPAQRESSHEYLTLYVDSN